LNLEIISVGGFVNGLTLDEISNGRSELKNKVVANLFKELQFIESWGSGVEKVQNSCNDKGIKFELIEKGLFVEAVFERPIKSDSAEKVSDSIGVMPNSAELVPNNAELTVEDGKIINFLKENQKITSTDVSKLLDLKERRSREILNILAKKGYVAKIGKTKGSYYELP